MCNLLNSLCHQQILKKPAAKVHSDVLLLSRFAHQSLIFFLHHQQLYQINSQSYDCFLHAASPSNCIYIYVNGNMTAYTKKNACLIFHPKSLMTMMIVKLEELLRDFMLG